MKTFFCLICLWFCEVAFGAGVIAISPSISCSIDDPTVTTGTTSVTFVHNINFTNTVGASSGRCYFELSDETVTKGLTGGLQFASDLNSITISGNAPSLGGRGSKCGANGSLTSPNVPGRTGWRFSNTTTNSGANLCTLSYTIALTLDKTSPNPTSSLCPKITGEVQDILVPNSKLSKTISFPCANTPISPQLTCSLIVPSNVNLGIAKPSDFPNANTTLVNPTSFPIRVNCAQKLAATFTPNLTLTYTTPSTLGCFAQNALTTGSPTNALVKIYSTNASNQKAEFCQQGSATPTTLAFPTSVANVLYDQTVNLTAAFERVGSAITPGAFTTSATFTVTYN